MVMNKTVYKHSPAGFCVDMCSTQLGKYIGSRIAGLYVKTIFSFLRNSLPVGLYQFSSQQL